MGAPNLLQVIPTASALFSITCSLPLWGAYSPREHYGLSSKYIRMGLTSC
jgi:hypothetical protein